VAEVALLKLLYFGHVEVTDCWKPL